MSQKFGQTTNPHKTKPSRSVRFGIGARLMSAFAIVAGFTILACIISYTSFSHVGSSFGLMTSQSLPQMNVAMRLSKAIGDISSTAAVIAMSKDENGLGIAVARFAELDKQMDTSIGSLPGFGIDAAVIEALVSVKKAFVTDIDGLRVAKEREFAARAQRENMTQQALDSHAAATSLLAPLVDSASFDLEFGLMSLSEPSTTPLADQIGALSNAKIPQLNNAWSLRAESNNIIGLYSEVAVGNSAANLVPLNDRFVSASEKLAKSLDSLPAEVVTTELKSAFEGLLSPGNNAPTIFALRSDELAMLARLDDLVQSSKQQSDMFAKSVSSLVDSIQTASLDKMNDSNSTLTDTKRYLMILAVVSIVASVMIAWFYVGNGLLRRLARIQTSISALADGELEVDIPARETSRADELGRMAWAVGVFRNNALDKLRADAEASEQRQRADEERRQREEATMTAAERQAHAVKALGAGLARMASGDLTFRLDQPFSAEYDQLREDFNSAIGSLNDVMSAIVAKADGMRASVDGIRDGSVSLSERTETQAASIEETAAALDEITRNVGRTASSAAEAMSFAAEAASNATHGSQVFAQTAEAIHEIEASSNKIGQIIGIINEITFQTNLLALNAGVEAARAGEAGRGFAVVASEVRSLAQRSAEAAREIRSLVTTSKDQVGKGVQLVAESVTVLDDIVRQVAQVNDSISKITISAQEQATGLREVNIAVTSMDKSTQQNAAMAEESTAASEVLTTEVAELYRMIRRFEVDGRVGQTQYLAAAE